MPLTLADYQKILDAPGLSGVAIGGGAITVHNTDADPNGPFKALWIGVSGTVKLVTVDGTTLTLTNVPVGILPIACTRIFSTGTTVTTPNTNIVGLK